MIAVNDGQCGLCTHFGEHQASDVQITQIRTSHKASETLVEPCEHPKHAALHLMVTPTSGCDGFTAAKAN